MPPASILIFFLISFAPMAALLYARNFVCFCTLVSGVYQLQMCTSGRCALVSNVHIGVIQYQWPQG